MKKLIVLAALSSMALSANATSWFTAVSDFEACGGLTECTVDWTWTHPMFGTFEGTIPMEVYVSDNPVFYGLRSVDPNVPGGADLHTLHFVTGGGTMADFDVSAEGLTHSADPLAIPHTFLAGSFVMDCGDVLAEELPTSFGLGDAFPNPFNPSTSINFDLPETEMVSLNVFNINGQLVNTLVNGTVEAGNHSVTFDASNLASGVYLYTIEAGAFTATKKLVLVK